MYELLQLIQSTHYTTRLSKIDLYADFVDEDVDISAIYQGFIDGRVDVFRKYISPKTGETSYRKSEMQYRGFINGDEIGTLYIGSNRSNSQLRLYDKRAETLQKKGSHLLKARNCKSWTRAEGIFRNEFSHQLSDEFLKIKSDDELVNLIACTLTQKFRLMYVDKGVVDCEVECTQMLLDCITNRNFVLSSPSSRNYDLAKNLSHLFKGSGVITTMFKIKKIFGDFAVIELLKFIEEYLDEFVPNDDCRYWLQKNTGDYQRNYSDFKKFMKDNMPIL